MSNDNQADVPAELVYSSISQEILDQKKCQFQLFSMIAEAEIAAVQEIVRKRVLALFERRELLTPETAADMRTWGHAGGFSLDATVRIEANDRAGLERLLRYCARPILLP